MEATTARRSRRWIILGVFGMLLVGSSSFLVFLKTKDPAPIPLPNPNGYDDLVQAGSTIQGIWPNQGNLDQASLEEIRPFVEANRSSLERARRGLTRECVVPIEDSLEGLTRQLESINAIRKLFRLFQAEARVFDADGRTGEALQDQQEILEMAQAITQGGLEIDVMTGWALQGQAITRIRERRDSMNPEAVRSVIAQLESLDRRRVGIDAIEGRVDRWYRGSYSPSMRMMMRWNGIERKTRLNSRKMLQTLIDRIQRQMRFLEVELAVHAFHQEKMKWPRSVGEMVPEYLPTLLIDPATHEPLEYPANPQGELTDALEWVEDPGPAVIKSQPSEVAPQQPERSSPRPDPPR